MPNYRRANVPGGTYFFTLVTYQRTPYFADEPARKLLGQCLRDCQKRWPFELNAIVLLPEHLHTIWTLPSGDSEYSRRWAWIKKEFTKRWLSEVNTKAIVNKALQKERRQGIWQPRFWEHTIESEEDFEAHFDYIHYNPVKHGYVKCPHEWLHSSFHRWVTAGVYEEAWACWGQEVKIFSFQSIEHNFGE
ncbi:transposase [Rubinisphaera sp.]|uniref:REP-associated tyrosine transposase n=1 Tax=Rubinisphaera sp. TaxID=2024857 RepID=UPI000C105D16|nr:transposase [Rubinisphaera sp.]MBV10171.1 transposase [Rubinisphaera sp.]HCS51029.1 transposase [Planctomycetaceae bacterium]|tara:strand:- start:4158 stop:4727 length:570 start_codon:yes stop_codon:yes gene_type:complete